MVGKFLNCVQIFCIFSSLILVYHKMFWIFTVQSFHHSFLAYISKNAVTLSSLSLSFSASCPVSPHCSLIEENQLFPLSEISEVALIEINWTADLYFRKQEKDAVRVIERAWCSYRDQQMFQLLKYAVCAAVSISLSGHLNITAW